MKTHEQSRITLSLIRMSFVLTTIVLLAVGTHKVVGNPDNPRLLNYQGKITDTNGPVTGTVSITFSIYDAGGSLLWTEPHDNVTVSNGLFNVILGSINPIYDVVLNGGERYLGLTVNGEEIMPRQQIVSVLFALKAQDTETLSGHPASDFGDGHSLDAADGSPADVVFVNDAGYVGIGTTNPENKLDVAGAIRSSNGGFVFPDGTVQTTAATGGGDGDWTISGNDIYSAVSGNVGIGTTSPAAKLHLQDGSVLFSGTTGSTPTSGAGVRMMWIPEKKAFRAGTVTGNQWDANNIGNISFAVGYNTQAKGDISTAMGWSTEASGEESTAMGFSTTASGQSSTAMGSGTTASGAFSTAMGSSTMASEQESTAMGHGTIASGIQSTAMGSSTTASGSSSTAMGSGTTASGRNSTAMGFYTTASGERSTAMGSYASTNGKKGSFVYGDNSTEADIVNAIADNQFMVRAAGGTIFYSNSSLTAGVSLAPGGGSWASISDRNRKENFKEEDGEEALRKIAGMSISSWNYKSQHPSIRHLGPTAQDFYAAFRLGESDTTITTTDIDGINMLAIQALGKRTTELKTKIEDLERVRAELAFLKAENTEMKRKMAQFETALQKIEALTDTPGNFDGSETGRIKN